MYEKTSSQQSTTAESTISSTLAQTGPAAESFTVSAGSGDNDEQWLEYWSEGSPAAQSIMEFVDNVCNKDSEGYIPPEGRVAVFDVDGTLIGERYPTYFDQCMLMKRLLHDDSYKPDEDDRKFAEKLDYALLHGEEEPESPRSTGQIAAESFKGFTEEEYRAYVRDFMSQPVVGFERMTYGEGFFKPMVSLVQYLSEHDFKIFICSGGERMLMRELTRDTLGQWIPPYQVIGSTFSLTAPGQGDTADRSYTYTAEDKVIIEGNMVYKNLKIGKVKSIVSEIGCKPILAFGNSSGDLAMGEYTVQNGGKAYMLLCDDDIREHGDLETAESFAAECAGLGFETISMKNDFATIYGDGVKCVEIAPQEEEERPAA